LFHPAAASRVLSVQGLLSPHSHPSSSEGAAPLPLIHRRFTRLLLLSQKPTRSHVRCLSASRLLSVQGRVLRVRLFTSPAPAPLFSFLSSRPSFLSTSVPYYSALSAHVVWSSGLHALHSAFQRADLRSSPRPCGRRDLETSSRLTARIRLSGVHLSAPVAPSLVHSSLRSPFGAHRSELSPLRALQLPFVSCRSFRVA
jgi:hypothetical protein